MNHLFIDGSVHAQKKVGYGAYLLVSGHQLPGVTGYLASEVKMKRFENTSSTRLELQTLLWALEEIELAEPRLIVYTDSQNIISLPGRRAHLEQTDYRSKQNKLLKNHELYQTFYERMDKLNFAFIKVKGHMPSDQKEAIDQFFSLVDRAARKALKGGRVS